MKKDTVASMLVVLAATLAPVAMAAGETPARGAEADLIKAETARFHAMEQGDTIALDRAVADELVFCHGNGHLENKAEFLQSFAGSRGGARSFEISEQNARVYGDVGVTHGRQTLHLGTMTLSDRYTGVYVRRDGRWQLVSFQSTPLPDPNRQAGPERKPDTTEDSR
jgi:hypothetical protein